MKSKKVQRLLRALIALVGAGIGAALAAAVLQLLTFTNPEYRVPARALVVIYTSTCVVGGLIFFLLSNRILSYCVEWGSNLEQKMDKMPFGQMLSCVTGLICGLIIAALVSQILNFMGTSLFTTAISAILYVVFATIGISVGYKRASDFTEMHERFIGFRERRAQRKSAKRSRYELTDMEDTADTAEAAPVAKPKLLDTSVIIDGRVFDVAKAGFLEGELVVPAFVLDELRHIADSADPLRRNRGRRGLDVLNRLQEDGRSQVHVEDKDYGELDEVDVKLLRLARDLGGAVLTNDYNLNKVAGVTGVPVLNINELAGALRPVVLPGEEMTVHLVREGREPGQGVAYLEDGTMVVVENGRRRVGETLETIVTTVLQTSAGRMIFGRVKGEEPRAV